MSFMPFIPFMPFIILLFPILPAHLVEHVEAHGAAIVSDPTIAVRDGVQRVPALRGDDHAQESCVGWQCTQRGRDRLVVPPAVPRRVVSAVLQRPSERLCLRETNVINVILRENVENVGGWKGGEEVGWTTCVRRRKKRRSRNRARTTIKKRPRRYTTRTTTLP